MKTSLSVAAAVAVLLSVCACGGDGGDETPDKQASNEKAFDKDPYPSTYNAYPAGAVLLQGATVYDGLGGIAENQDVRSGQVEPLGLGLRIDPDTRFETRLAGLQNMLLLEIPNIIPQGAGQHGLQASQRPSVLFGR